MSNFPSIRFRRNKKYEWLRNLIAENSLSIDDLIWPVFVMDGNNIKQPIEKMPGVYRYSIDSLIIEAKRAAELGIPALALFPVIDPKLKTYDGREAYNPNNLVCRAIRALKDNVDIGIIVDVALDPYTTHGHDGIFVNNQVVNDDSVESLVKQALCQVKAGCDAIAPSDMMDGRIVKIRNALEQENYHEIPIISYTAKYASNFYGPFRDALNTSSCLGKSDKKTYQLDYRNSSEALRIANLDIKSGADMLIVKPGMPFLDIISLFKQNINIPIFAYQVSGEYAMLKFAAQNNCFDEKEIMIESLISFKRAGASAIITYAAIEVAEYLLKNK